MKAVLATEIKCAVICAVISLAFASQASAVLRPLFPIKPTAPSNGELIIIGDELVLQSAKNLCYITGASLTANGRIAGYRLCHKGHNLLQR